jgi:hypothetical protein
LHRPEYANKDTVEIFRFIYFPEKARISFKLFPSLVTKSCSNPELVLITSRFLVCLSLMAFAGKDLFLQLSSSFRKLTPPR